LFERAARVTPTNTVPRRMAVIAANAQPVARGRSVACGDDRS
jgi:hypothetical protein